VVRIRIQDVAREAGVGVGTVSRVLSGSPRVAAATRQRVLATIERLGYAPVLAARALRTGRTHVLRAVVPLFQRHFYAEVLRGIERALAGSGYSLAVAGVEERRERDHWLRLPGGRTRADGQLIVSLTPSAGEARQLRTAPWPTVLVDATAEGLPSVGVDHAAAARQVVAHLLRLGHTRIALVDCPADPFALHPPAARREGYRAALATAGVPTSPAYELVTACSALAGATALERLLALPTPPSAICFGSDVQAVGALHAARGRGLRVPGDLSIVGYGDTELAECVGLTTVHIPMRELGERAATLLLRALDGDTPLTPCELPVALVVRASCGAPPVDAGSRG